MLDIPNEAKDHKYYMNSALEEAKKALSTNEVPVGAIVVLDNQIIGRGFNQMRQSNSVSSHAEINAINNAGKYLKNYRLNNCDLYVTVEPCYMCCMALVHARIKKLYFGIKQPKTGAVLSIDKFFENSSHNHKVSSEYLGENNESKKLMLDFFKARR